MSSKLKRNLFDLSMKSDEFSNATIEATQMALMWNSQGSLNLALQSLLSQYMHTCVTCRRYRRYINIFMLTNAMRILLYYSILFNMIIQVSCVLYNSLKMWKYLAMKTSLHVLWNYMKIWTTLTRFTMLFITQFPVLLKITVVGIVMTHYRSL